MCLRSPRIDVPHRSRFRRLAILAALLGPAHLLAQDDIRGSTERRNVAVLLFEGVELLDFAGPAEVFSAARGPDGRAFNVYTVAESTRPLTSQGFVRITPQHAVTACPKPDIFVVPGGGVDQAMRSDEVRAWIHAAGRDAELVLSVCNGALILAQNRLLDGLEVTTHHGSLDDLAILAPSARVYTNRRFVDSGRIVTSAGVSAGIDGALHVVTRLLGADAAQRVARYMEYHWRPDDIARQNAEPGRLVDSPRLRTIRTLMSDGQDAALAEYRRLLADSAAWSGPAESRPPGRDDLMASGWNLLAADRVEDATKVLGLVAAAYPDSSRAHAALGEAQGRSGRVQPAIDSLRQALKLEPQSAAALRELRRLIWDDRLKTDAQQDEARELIRRHMTASTAVLTPQGEPGEPMVVTGTVRDSAGKPVPGATVYAYHTNHEGVYSPVGGNAASMGDSLHPRLFGYVRTDSAGRYEYRTIRPGPYPRNGPPAHVHYEVSAPGFEPTVTELMFADDDRLSFDAREEFERAGFIIYGPIRDAEGTQRCACDIVLRAAGAAR